MGGRGDVALMSGEETATASGEVAVTSNEPVAIDPPVDLPEGDVEPVPAPEPMPVEPMPVDPMPEPEEITVTLVDVQPDLWWIWDVHGSTWLVPAYRFVGEDGASYTVPAVTDDFLVQTEPPVTTEPAPDTPPTTDVTEPNPGDGPLAQYLGLSLAEFEKAVAAEGLGPVRIVEIDGEPQAITMDLREGRVNVAVETRDGVQYVVSADVESIDGPAPTTPPTTPPDTAPATTVAAEQVPITGTYEGVAFYPACGTEILEHEGVTWYPVAHVGFDPADEQLAQLLADIAAADREPSPVAGVNGFAARVAEPGPGDDVGTLVVWSDGVARWVSDSGTLDVWLVDDELTYDWVC
jgi:hypothetical protein